MSNFTGAGLRAALQVSGTDSGSHILLASSEAAAALPTRDSRVLTESEAAELTGRIENALFYTDQLLIAAHVGRIWIAMECDSWDDWADKYFGDRPLVSFARRDRPVVVRALSDGGLSSRAIGRALGVGQTTVMRDIASTEPNGSVEPGGPVRETIVGRDGKERPRRNSTQEQGIPECDICGDFLQECADLPEGECQQYNKFVLGERGLPPGPRMPPQPRNRPPSEPPKVLDKEIVFSNGKGLTHLEDTAQSEDDPPNGDCGCVGSDRTGDNLSADTDARVASILVHRLASVDEFLALADNEQELTALVHPATVGGPIPLGHEVVDLVQGYRDGLLKVMRELPRALARAEAILTECKGHLGKSL